MIDFYDIKGTAVKYFYANEHGEDFIWLKNNWELFDAENIKEAELLVYTLGFIYHCFFVEAFLQKLSLNTYTVKEYIEEYHPELKEYQQAITDNEEKVFLKLLEVFGSAAELLREFASITIEFQFPNLEGIRYIMMKSEYLLTRNKIEGKLSDNSHNSGFNDNLF